MDVVYPLGTGSHHNNLELLYSLRALDAYVTDVDRVIIVGADPGWLKNVVILPFKDGHACKEANIMLKVKHACTALQDLTQRFLHVHDDHFCLGPVAAGDVPYWHGRPLRQLANALRPGSHYRASLENTETALWLRNLPVLNYDLHLPIVYDKHRFVEINERFDWNTRHGFVVKSLYANAAGVAGEPFTDLKLEDRPAMDELVRRLKGRPWWSVSTPSLGPTLKALLAALYPAPSKYER